MKRLLIAPLLLTLLMGCTNQKNRIFSGEWISYEEINKIEGPRKGIGVVEYKFIDCINNICQYKVRIYSADMGEKMGTTRVYCDTLETEQISDISGKGIYRKPLNYSDCNE